MVDLKDTLKSSIKRKLINNVVLYFTKIADNNIASDIYFLNHYLRTDSYV